MYLQRLSYEEFIAAGVSEKLARLLTATEHPLPHVDMLSIEPVDPDWDYWAPKGVTDAVGLWDVNADPYVRWCNHGRTEYVWIFHDDEDAELIATSEQGLLAHLMHQYYELIDADSDDQVYAEVTRFARYIGFREVERYLEILREHPDLETYSTRLKELIANL